jgi:hypothetical protein
MRVDLPDPDGPMIAEYCPVGNATVTASNAVTLVSPSPKTLVISWALAAADVVVGEDVTMGPSLLGGVG